MIAWLVGGVLCATAIMMALVPGMMRELSQDQLVMRAFGITLVVAGWMLARAGWVLALGARRVFAVFIALYLFAVGALLLARPVWAGWLYENGRAIAAPWVFGIPGLLTLWLGRWDRWVNRGG